MTVRRGKIIRGPGGFYLEQNNSAENEFVDKMKNSFNTEYSSEESINNPFKMKKNASDSLDKSEKD